MGKDKHRCLENWRTMFLTAGYASDRAGKEAVLALLSHDPSGTTDARVHTVDCPDEAIACILQGIRESGKSSLKSCGIASPLSFSSGRSKFRPMDEYLAKLCPTALNRPSCLVSHGQVLAGLCMALRLKEIFPDIILNETRPGALFHVLSGKGPSCLSGSEKHQWLRERFRPPITLPIYNEIEFSALLSAYACWQGVCGNWTNNLMVLTDDLIKPAGDVRFWCCDDLD